MQFEGIYIPVITPFHDDGSVDENGFAEVIEFLIDAGVHGIVAQGRLASTMRRPWPSVPV